MEKGSNKRRKKKRETLFCGCSQIDYVCGPRWTVTEDDITTGLHVFIYNMEIRNEQPSRAAKRASLATGYDFFCYDRVEVEDRLQARYPMGTPVATSFPVQTTTTTRAPAASPVP